MSSYGRDQLNKWLKTIDINCDRFLDIGGSQLPCFDKFKSWNVKEYKILDLPIPHECKQKPDIEMDLNKIMPIFWENNIFKIIPEFDVAFCGEVSEYLWNPVQALKNINLLLKQGGILYMSFHFIYPVHGPTNQDFLRYTPWGIKKILEETGFKIEEIVPRVAGEPQVLMDFYQRERMRPFNNYKRHHEVGHMIKAIKI